MRGTLQSWSLAVAAAAFVHAPPRSSAVRLAAPAARPRAVCALIIADSTLEEHFRFGLDIVEKAPSLASTIPEVLHDPEVLALLAESDAYLRPVTEYLRPSAQQTLRLALEVALIAHHGQRRRSGEAYITHPVAVAHILATSNMERATVVSGLLHDTVEDTSLTFDEIEALFGFTVRRIVEGETKVSKLPKMVRSHLDEEALHSHANFEKPTSKVEEQVENMRSMFIAMADDWRIVVVKLADRLHNMRTLMYMPIEKRASIARETLEIFAPLAHRLGMWQFKTELSDLSFMYLFPSEYEQLDQTIAAKFVQYQETLDQAKATLETQLNADPWLQGRLRSVHVVGRTKSIYSTFKKMQRHECGIERILDLVALRVVLNPEQEGVANAAEEDENALCYHVLGKVHSSYTPLPRTLKDYISSPKPNGYRSLHTTVLVGTQPLEVQIRTQAMHHIAEYGAAAHWAYKDQAASLPWLQIIRQWQVQVDSAHEFMQLVRQELLGTRVFVFTRNGRILNLARGATIGDAAKHQSLTLASYTPLLNGRVAQWDKELSNGDIVSIERSSMLLVDRLAGRRALTDADDETGSLAEALSDELAQDEAAGRDPQIMGMEIKQRAIDYLRERRRSEEWSLCKDCLPLIGDELIGASLDHPSDATGGTIHCAFGECPSLQDQLKREGYRLVDAAGQRDAFHTVLREQCARSHGLNASFVVTCTDRRGMLVDVASVVTEGVTNILNVYSEIFSTGGKSAFKYEVIVQNRTQLETLMERLREVPDVTKCVRGKDLYQ